MLFYGTFLRFIFMKNVIKKLFIPDAPVFFTVYTLSRPNDMDLNVDFKFDACGK